MTDPFRVCFVCTGNICRSPTAEVVFRHLAGDAGLAGRLLVDSAGTGPWHAGHDMDPRARHALLSRGYRPHDHVAKQFLADDFGERDVVVAIDSGHLARLGRLALLAGDPEEAGAALSLLRSYDRSAVLAGELDVPDPYYDDARGFELVLDQVERACAGLLDALRPRLGAA
ncbi:MAG TPA: low molecular weight protein-tyrosine-phosphatase [Jatrophihabitans sp.]|nr:low molecular weight protein-tyrosine-phosphatase [Jatrophihabitans sp.]